MKKTNLRRTWSVLAVLGLALTTGCGSGGDTGITTAGVVAPGYGYGTGVGTSGCVPLNAPIGFQVVGAYVDSVTVAAGRLPYSGQVVGGVSIGAGSVGGQYYGQAMEVDYMGYPFVSAQMSMSIGYGSAYQGAPYSGFPQNTYGGAWGASPTVGALQGSIVLTAQMINKIMADMGAYGGGGYYGGMSAAGPFQYGMGQSWSPGYQGWNNPSQICISQIAMNIGRSSYTLHGGQVFLYMNGSANGYVLKF